MADDYLLPYKFVGRFVDGDEDIGDWGHWCAAEIWRHFWIANQNSVETTLYMICVVLIGKAAAREAHHPRSLFGMLCNNNMCVGGGGGGPQMIYTLSPLPLGIINTIIIRSGIAVLLQHSIDCLYILFVAILFFPLPCCSHSFKHTKNTLHSILMKIGTKCLSLAFKIGKKSCHL